VQKQNSIWNVFKMTMPYYAIMFGHLFKHCVFYFIFSGDYLFDSLKMVEFQSILEKYSNHVSKDALELVMNKYCLFHHLSLISKFMLFEQGDFIIRLVELVG